MTKDIKDYLHLYLGCDTLDKDNNRSYLVAAYDDGVSFVRYANEAVCISFNRDTHKLILRPLSDMRDEEAIFVKRVLRDNHGIDTIKTVLQNGWHLGHISANASQMFEITRYLLSKGFDLFGLIDAGLGIDDADKAGCRVK